MEQSQGGARSPERVRYRLTRLQRLLSLLPAVVGVAVQVPFWWDGGSSVPIFGALITWVVLWPVMLFISWPFGITLTPSAAIVHKFRRRTVPWLNVQAIQIESVFGSRTVVIYEAGGRRTRLRAPITGFLNRDRDFEEKFHTIGRWWLEHRGPDWAPAPPPGPQWGGQRASDGNPYAPPA